MRSSTSSLDTPNKRSHNHSSRTSSIYSPNVYEILDSYPNQQHIEPRVTVINRENNIQEKHKNDVKILMSDVIKRADCIIDSVNKQNEILTQVQSNMKLLSTKFDKLSASTAYPSHKCVTISPFPFNEDETIKCAVQQLFNVGLDLNISSFRDTQNKASHNNGTVIVQVPSVRQRADLRSDVEVKLMKL